MKRLGGLRGSKRDNINPVISLMDIENGKIELNTEAMRLLKLYSEGNLEGYDRVDIAEDKGKLFIAKVGTGDGASVSKTGKITHYTMASYLHDSDIKHTVSQDSFIDEDLVWHELVPFGTVEVAEEEQVVEEENNLITSEEMPEDAEEAPVY